MVSSTQSVLISRSAEEVFRYVADLRNEPAWHVDVAAVPDDPDPIPVVGKTYRVTFKPFMGKTDGRYTVVAVEPGAKIVYQAVLGGFQPEITYDIAPAGNGARFTRSVQMHPRGLTALMTPMMAVMVPRRNKVFVAKVKEILER